MINITCHKCGHEFEVPIEYSGRNVVCNKCDTLNATTGKCPTELNLYEDWNEFDEKFDKMMHELLRYERHAPAVEFAQ